MPWLPLLLLACSGDDLPPPPSSGTAATPTDTGEPCGDHLTWNGAGQAFLLTYCTACHASTATGEARKGAPEGVDFDTLEGTRTWAERIRVRTLETFDMPPAGGPRAEERDLLSAWLDCGLPGEENPLPTGASSEALIMGYSAFIDTEHDGGDFISVTRTIEPPNPDYREGIFRTDHYRARPVEAQFLGYEHYDADGELTREVSWDPPLELLTGLEQVSTMTWSTPDDSGTLDQVWTRSVETDPPTDGHALDPDAWELVLTEDGGEEHGWLLSEVEGFVGQWSILGAELTEFQQVSTGGVGTNLSEFPLQADRLWVETILVVAVDP